MDGKAGERHSRDAQKSFRGMTTAERNERINALAKVAIAIHRRNAVGFIIETIDGRACVYDLRHNEMTLSLRWQLDDPTHMGNSKFGSTHRANRLAYLLVCSNPDRRRPCPRGEFFHAKRSNMRRA